MRHEWTLAAVGAVLLSVGMTWPVLRDPLHTLPGDYWDPSLQSWEMAWSGFAVTHHPGELWQSNAFHSEQWGFAYSDTLLGYLPAGLIGSGPVAAVLRYNVIFCLVFALAFFGAYVLARQLGSRIPGALVAGAAFAYAPWRWTQVNHLHVLSTGGIALSLAMLARGHGYSLRRREQAGQRPGWALAGWLVAAWQITLGFGVGLPFGYAIGILAVVALMYRRRWRERYNIKLLRFDLIGAAVFVIVAALMAYPYLKMISVYPYGRRGYDDIKFYSPAVQGFFTAPPTDRVWGGVQEPMRAWLLRGRGGWEAVLLPGFVLYALALVGLFRSTWRVRHRVIGLVAVLVVGFLAMGMRAPTTVPYRVLHTILPGWDAIRTPGRLVVWMTLLLALLAAGAVSSLTVSRRWLLIIPVLLVLVEGLQSVPTPVVPRPPVSFASLRGPVWVLPSNYKDDELTMLWSTDGFVSLENGSSGLLPAGLVQTRDATRNFPDQPSVARLRELGVRTVLILRDPNGAKLPIHLQGAQPPPNALTAPLDGLDVTRQILPDAIVFSLN